MFLLKSTNHFADPHGQTKKLNPKTIKTKLIV